MTIYIEKGEQYHSIKNKVVNATGLEISCCKCVQGTKFPKYMRFECGSNITINEETFLVFPPKHLIKLKGKL